ncbi:hypothetical protein BATDEDRAFT_88213 [Batrachochytrium dendrobatidis JAM81]|uniref:Uncharacterized protein n=1 Tax=Batrachochytrium dendrobatidis (strain JAM81 / FGSC 10211) TaxID=684364 RepID=F4P1B8_BATDJ|nr:uncharacterized protein BATDEDRAFT_88213 [Batrachochytrium dendrobatidis JAM81]EGF80972.1 hypothetical protein BATDEDRAFT_88213 [Batrachochytrium dendrobatidis JAM81]|eukprot:XP_006678769.1 hypothetical protein BATDEDRAFT_88213 [Batrachochytrium dendrobatidis JAM81]
MKLELSIVLLYAFSPIIPVLGINPEPISTSVVDDYISETTSSSYSTPTQTSDALNTMPPVSRSTLAPSPNNEPRKLPRLRGQRLDIKIMVMFILKLFEMIGEMPGQPGPDGYYIGEEESLPPSSQSGSSSKLEKLTKLFEKPPPSQSPPSSPSSQPGSSSKLGKLTKLFGKSPPSQSPPSPPSSSPPQSPQLGSSSKLEKLAKLFEKPPPSQSPPSSPSSQPGSSSKLGKLTKLFGKSPPSQSPPSSPPSSSPPQSPQLGSSSKLEKLAKLFEKPPAADSTAAPDLILTADGVAQEEITILVRSCGNYGARMFQWATESKNLMTSVQPSKYPRLERIQKELILLFSLIAGAVMNLLSGCDLAIDTLQRDDTKYADMSDLIFDLMREITLILREKVKLLVAMLSSLSSDLSRVIKRLKSFEEQTLVMHGTVGYLASAIYNLKLEVKAKAKAKALYRE